MAVKATSKGVERRHKAKPGMRFNPGRLPALLFVIFLIYLAVVTGNQLVRLCTLESSVRRAEQELKAMQAQNAALWERVRLLQSDAYIESLAREKFGLVKPGEVPVVVKVKPTDKQRRNQQEQPKDAP